MTSVSVTCQKGPVAADVRALIWDTFFGSRGRGLSLDVHSPWLHEGNGVAVVTARDAEGALIGCLVVKDHAEPPETVAMIGYVCVSTAHRGQGIAHMLVQEARTYAEARGLKGLVLWTQTPAVYRRQGFLADPRDVFLQFAPADATPAVQDLSVIDPADLGGRGVPAFAKATLTVRAPGGNAEVTLLETSMGTCVAQWQGADAAVVDLLSAYFSKEPAAPWWLNALEGDPLIAAVTRRFGDAITVQPSARQVLVLNGAEVADLPGIRVLDRV